MANHEDQRQPSIPPPPRAIPGDVRPVSCVDFMILRRATLSRLRETRGDNPTTIITFPQPIPGETRGISLSDLTLLEYEAIRRQRAVQNGHGESP
ncbi:MAG: hypothetical protein HY344_01665 [Candidatus Levybacteria bacterium]|nr:hypothetical protein [Candidatus Levybacteria bacterium]